MTPIRLNIITIVVVVLAATGFAIGLFIPGVRRVNAREQEIAFEQQTVVARQNEVGDVSAVYGQLVKLSEDVSSFRVQLPSDRQFGAFLNDLSDALTQCGIRDYLVQPQSPRRVVAENLPESLKLAAGTGILPLRLTFEASFRETVELIDRLEAMPRLIYVERLDMVKPTEAAGPLSVSMVVHAFHHNHEALGVFARKGAATQP